MMIVAVEVVMMMMMMMILKIEILIRQISGNIYPIVNIPFECSKKVKTSTHKACTCSKDVSAVNSDS